MTARAPSRLLYLPDIRYILFRNFSTSRLRITGLLGHACVMREFHPVQE